MADDKKDKKDKEETPKEAASGAPQGKIGIVTWLIMMTAVVLISGSGFLLGRLLAGSASEKTPPAADESTPDKTEPPANEATPAGQETWYYSTLDSIVVNPDEPGATRFVRVGLILEMSGAIPQEKATPLIESKKPLLINWLNLYFKGLSLSQMENERDMNRILTQICDGFNEILFPDAEPQIKKILIREFNIQ